MSIETEIELEGTAPEVGEGSDYEIVDDTPEEDRGRAPLSGDDEAAAREVEMDKHSESVQKRINQLSHRYHDERRAKEDALRKSEEALRFAQVMVDEHNRMKDTLTWGQQEYAKEVQAKIEYAQKLAEDKYRRAYESGDTDGVVAAQQDMNDVLLQRSRFENTPLPVPQSSHSTPPLQSQENPVYHPQQPALQPAAPLPTRDPKAEAWGVKNPWFGADEEMTSLAYGLHAKLVNSGVDPQSDEYYATIDKRMREVYPAHFGASKPRASSPVAPAGRSTAGRKVTLTKTQVQLAKRLGVPLSEYAKSVAQLEKANG